MKRVKHITFDQQVLINDIFGYVDFIGEDIIVLVDKEKKSHFINHSDIREVYSKNESKINQATYYLN